jgi:hypothetical protein
VTEAMSEVTEAELLQAWRLLSTEARDRITRAIADEIVHPKPPAMRARPAKTRGARAKTHTKARRIAALWRSYRASHGNPSVKAAWRSFVRTLPPDLRVKALAAKTASNLITRGDNLNRQRPELRRLVAALRAPRGLWSISSEARNTVRAVIKAARVGRGEDLAEIKRRADQEVFYNDSARRALLGDDAQSFIRFPK